MKELEMKRRTVLTGGAAMVAATSVAAEIPSDGLYGLIGQMIAKPGKREDLAAILTAGTTNMPGCLSYIVAKDAANSDALWITEVWIDAAHHTASLKLPAVQSAITQARPIIAGFGQRFETVPVGGVGLSRT